MASLITDALLAKLKRYNPSRVRAYAGDDDFRDIAVPTRRKKWTQVIETIESRAWSRVVFMDKSGAELGYHDNTEPSRELEDLGGTDTRASKLRSESEWIVKLVITAQRDAMTFRDAEVTSLLRAQGDVVREITSAMKELSEIHREQRAAATEAVAIRAAAAAEAAGGNEWKELLEAAPQLLQMLPMLKQLLAPGEARPKNGA